MDLAVNAASCGHKTQIQQNREAEMMDPLHPNGRVGTPQELAELAELIVWLCSPQASIVRGAIIPVDGGFVSQ